LCFCDWGMLVRYGRVAVLFLQVLDEFFFAVKFGCFFSVFLCVPGRTYSVANWD